MARLRRLRREVSEDESEFSRGDRFSTPPLTLSLCHSLLGQGGGKARRWLVEGREEVTDELAGEAGTLTGYGEGSHRQQSCGREHRESEEPTASSCSPSPLLRASKSVEAYIASHNKSKYRTPHHTTTNNYISSGSSIICGSSTLVIGGVSTSFSSSVSS